MTPELPSEKEADFSHYFDQHDIELQRKIANAEAEAQPSRFKPTKKFYLLAGVLLVMILIQVAIIYTFSSPKPQPVKKDKSATQANKPKTNSNTQIKKNSNININKNN